MKTLQNLETKNIFFLITLGVIMILAFQIISPFVNIILISLVIVQIFYPFYRWFLKKTKNKGLSTTLSVITSLLFFIIPVILLSILIFRQIEGLITSQSFIKFIENSIKYLNNEFINNLNQIFSNIGIGDTIINPIDLNLLNLSDTITEIGKNLGNFLFSFLNQFVGVLFSLFLIIISLIFIFPKYENLEKVISKFSPLDDKLDFLLVRKFKATTKGVIKGSFAVAFVQSTAVIIPMIILGVEAPLFLWLIMFLLSIIPVGSGLVWGPVGLFMISNGLNTANTIDIFLGIGLIAYSAIIINVIDSALRPRLMRNTVNLHPLVVIFSVIGGIYSFGILGIIYGPLIMVFFISIMSIYRHRYLNEISDEEIMRIEEAQLNFDLSGNLKGN